MWFKKKKKDLKRSMIVDSKDIQCMAIKMYYKVKWKKIFKHFLLSLSRNMYTHVHINVLGFQLNYFLYISTCENTAYRIPIEYFQKCRLFLVPLSSQYPSPRITLFGFLLSLNILPSLNISYKWYQIIYVLLSLTSSTHYNFEIHP